MGPERTGPAAIVGGGLVGALLAVFLRRRGFDVVVYERLPDLRKMGAVGGRSINLVLTSRGIRALDRVGLAEGAGKLTVPVRGRMMHAVDAELTYQPYGRDDTECNYSISRGGLNEFLVDEAERQGVRFVFDHRLLEMDPDRGRLRFRDEAGARDVEVEAQTLFGADGAGSAVRAALVQSAGLTEDVEMLGHDYKELLIPAAEDGSYRIEQNALHIWPRGRLMLMALPNIGGSFTVTLYLPSRGSGSFDGLNSPKRVREFFEREFPDSIPLIPRLDEEFFENPTSGLGTVRCDPWQYRDRVLLIGDAAHAIVPFFGQGMNCGFEDCLVLDDLIDEHGTDAWDTIFAELTRLRKTNADAIADMALENFVEMRDLVGDEAFLLRKQVEHRLERQMPREYRSRYSMVMYSSIPYRRAFEVGRIQGEILDELCRGLDSAESLDLGKARELVSCKLAPFLERHAISLAY